MAPRTLDYLKDAEQLNNLRGPAGHRLQRLNGDRRGEYSIRINRQYRICWEWTEKGAQEVEIDDDHD